MPPRARSVGPPHGDTLPQCATAAAQQTSSKQAAELLIAAAQIERDRHSQFSELFWHVYQGLSLEELGEDTAATLQTLGQAMTMADQAWGDHS